MYFISLCQLLTELDLHCSLMQRKDSGLEQHDMNVILYFIRI
jgi:hypothetical protein